MRVLGRDEEFTCVLYLFEFMVLVPFPLNYENHVQIEKQVASVG